MASSTIKGIIFDFGGVFTRSDVTTALLDTYDRLLGLEPGTLLSTLYSGPVWEAVSTGQMTLEEYWERTGMPYEERLPVEFAALKRGLFFSEPINTATIDLARALRRRYPLALCSNAVSDLGEILAGRPDIRDLFDVVVVSAQVGMRKPNPAILTLTAERLGLPVKACLLLDDKERNINAAASIGMPGIVFTSAEEVRATLEALGLLEPCG